MAIHSMTGFGRRAVDLGGVTHTVEVRAVNHRFLDIKVRLPRGLALHETALRLRVGERLERGRIDLTVTAAGGDAAPPRAVEINWPLADAVRAAHARLAEKLGVPDTCDTAAITAWPGVLVPIATEDADAEGQAAALLDAVDRALDDLLAMRRAEGATLAAVVDGHLAAIEAHRAALLADAPAQAEAWRARFEKRLAETLAAVGREVDEGRLLHEVAAFAEKTDVAEELARLDSHVAQARGLVADGDPEGVGRRLDFICQEMLRETNTVGSKVQAVEMTRRVVDLKAELERLREQIQNVE